MAHAQRVTFSCLQKTTPSNCPLCRRGYNPDRIKRLHVDRPTESPENETAQDVTKWLEQIALVSAGQTNNDDWMDVARDAQIWLESRSPETVCLYSRFSVHDAAIGRVLYSTPKTFAVPIHFGEIANFQECCIVHRMAFLDEWRCPPYNSFHLNVE